MGQFGILMMVDDSCLTPRRTASQSNNGCSSNQLTHFMITASALLRFFPPVEKKREIVDARVETFSHTQRRGRRYGCWYHPLIEVTWSGDKLAMEAHPMFASVRSISSLIMLSTWLAPSSPPAARP